MYSANKAEQIGISNHIIYILRNLNVVLFFIFLIDAYVPKLQLL